MQQLRLVRSGRAPVNAHPITSPHAVIPLLADIAKSDRENFVVFHLNAAGCVIARETVSIGSLSSATVHPREVFKAAILNNSAAIVCAHNHPGGSLNFSPEDLFVTRRLVECGRLLGIPVRDHLLVANRREFNNLSLTHPEIFSAVHEGGLYE